MRAAVEPTDIKRDLVGLLPRLRRFALTLTRDVREADDLVCNVCEQAIAHSHLWNGQGRIESWLYTTMRAVWADDSRRKTMNTQGPANDKGRGIRIVASSDIPPDQLQTMFLSMPEGLASVFVLVSVEKHSYRETADILKISVGVVMGKLASARMRLAAMANKTAQKRA